MIDYSLPLRVLMTREYCTTRELANGNIRVPVGTPVRIFAKRNGLAIESAPCTCCGVRVSVTRVPPYALEVRQVEGGEPS